MADLTASKLLELRMKLENSWKGTALERSKAVNVESAKAVLANQTAKFSGLDDWQKDNKIKVTFINNCALDVSDCEDNCTLDGAEYGTGAKDYAPNFCKKVDFSINEEDFRTNDYTLEEMFTENTTRALGKLDEWVAQTVLTKIQSYAGPNAYPAPWTYNNTNKDTEVPASQWGLSMIPILLNQMTLNNMGDVYYINDGSLFIDFYNAMINQGNLDGKGNATLIQQLKMYFDQINFGKTGVDDNLLAINRDAVALKTVNRHSDTPRVIGGTVGQTRYTVKSPNLDGVKYDAYYSVTCKSINGKDTILHTWRFVVNGLVALNPEGCPISIQVGGVPTTVQQTGVLAYKRMP